MSTHYWFTLVVRLYLYSVNFRNVLDPHEGKHFDIS